MADSTSLFVGQLSDSATEKDLESCFDKYGRVVKGKLIFYAFLTQKKFGK